MKLLILLTGMLFAGPLLGQAHGEKERKEDIRRHRAMAAAHEAAVVGMLQGMQQRGLPASQQGGGKDEPC